MCRACERIVKCHTGETCVVPQWVQREKLLTCYAVEGCGETAHTSTTVATYDIAWEYLDLVQSADSDTTSLALCNLISSCSGQLDLQYHVQHMHHSHDMVEIILDDVLTSFKLQHTADDGFRWHPFS